MLKGNFHWLRRHRKYNGGQIIGWNDFLWRKTKKRHQIFPVFCGKFGRNLNSGTAGTAPAAETDKNLTQKVEQPWSWENLDFDIETSRSSTKASFFLLKWVMNLVFKTQETWPSEQCRFCILKMAGFRSGEKSNHINLVSLCHLQNNGRTICV